MTPRLSDELQKVVEQNDGGPVEVEGDGVSCVLMTVDVYRAILRGLPDNDRDYAQCVQGIRRGLKSLERGEGIPLDEAFETVRKKHNIPADT
jgi:hypothetical protein